MKTQVQPTKADTAKAILYLIGLFILFFVVPFGASFIDYFMNAVFN